MSFVQIIEYKTTRVDEMRALSDEWEKATEGKRASTRSLMCIDRDNADSMVIVVEFPSYEEAMKNSELPETQRFAEQLAKLCDGPPTFRNLDVEQVLS